MYKLILVSCLIAISFGAYISNEKPHFRKSGKPILPLKPARKIVGGVGIDIEDAPYQVALEKDNYLVCGGSIANQNHIITAAQCTRGLSASDLQIRAGTNHLFQGGTVIQVASFVTHENYSGHDYDVSILTLKKNITFDDTKQPIALTDKEPADGEISTVSGWGTMEEGDPFIPPTLLSVDVPIVNRDECNGAYDGEITDRMICAGVPEGGLDRCDFDNGGPLVINGKLAGIVSWGRGCAEPGYPGVYGSVFGMKEWIESHL